MGNEVRASNGETLFQRDINIPPDLIEDLVRKMQISKYKIRTGNHIEIRTGMINFSIVGRNANDAERKHYNIWDSENKERKYIANQINEYYKDLDASVGGSISIDIIEKGKDKGQIVQPLVDLGYKKIIFYGDKCLPGGNDYGIVRELEKQKIDISWHNVKGPDSLIRRLANEEP